MLHLFYLSPLIPHPSLSSSTTLYDCCWRCGTWWMFEILGYFIRNTKTTPECLGWACKKWPIFAFAERPERENEGRDWGRGKKERMRWQQLKGRVGPAFITHSPFYVLPFLPALFCPSLSMHHRLPFCLCLLVVRQQLWEEMKSKMSSHRTHLHPHKCARFMADTSSFPVSFIFS